MRLIVITLVLGSAATVPTTSFVQMTKLDGSWLSPLSEDQGPSTSRRR